MKNAGLFALLSSALVGSCVTPPQYDDQTDKLISQLQTDVDTEFVSLETLDQKIDRLSNSTDAASKQALSDAKTKASYESNASFYDKVAVDLTGLQIRVDAEPSPATSHLDTSINDLRANLLGADNSMQATHQIQNTLSMTYLQEVQKLVDAEIGALLTRELGLKSATSTQTSNTNGQVPSSSSSASKSTSSKTPK